ncbi:hypothetical protein CK203_083931 [Vitis vinifera]|uniref:Uncharacterized protein n=1 Tax=Vitis vinifera TaxID=29760 RepID=A0A438D173_VITVI|nr:hypothetical protein CK203_083931 [Vitis vinifera]
MVERFFSGKITETAGQDAGNFTLLSGPPSCGKTSLLFQFAFNAAVEGHSGNRDVVFICTRRRLESKPPCLSQGVDPSSDMFQHVQMKYVEDDEAIKKYFAAFHLHHKFPVAVIIDDFEPAKRDTTVLGKRFGNGSDTSPLSQCHSSCQGLLMVLPVFIFNFSSKTAPCKVLLSDTHHGDSPSCYSSTRDGFHLSLRLKVGLSVESYINASFEDFLWGRLWIISSHEWHQFRKWQLREEENRKVLHSFQYLFLEDVTEDDDT